MTAAEHWDDAYAGGDATVSWQQERPEPSLSAITELDLGTDVPIVDVGGGSSALAGALVEAGHSDLTVVDMSRVALDLARDRLGAGGDAVTWVAPISWRGSRGEPTACGTTAPSCIS